jgi:conjugal transfer pilus assembly protein TraK
LPAPSGQAAYAPIKLDLKTERGTFALLLQPMDVPGDTLVLKPVGAAPAMPTSSAGSGSAKTRAASHVRAIKALTLAMANPDLAGEGAPQPEWLPEGGQEFALWQEARFVLKARYPAPGLVGEHYELTNISRERMVIDERELFGDGVVSVAVRAMALSPGQTTAVWVIRQSDEVAARN